MRRFTGRSIRYVVTAVCLAALSGVAAFGTQTTVWARPATKPPLVFGLPGTNTGPMAIPQDGQAFQAYIDNWNAHGGYKGHPIQLINLDGQFNPAIVRANSRTLVDEKDVIAIAHDYDTLDCLLNNSYYQQANIAVLGGGTGCYIPGTNFPPYRTPGTMGLAVLAQFGFDSGAEKVALQTPSFIQPLLATLQSSVDTTKGELIVPPFTPITPTAADFDGFIAEAKSAGATAVISLVQTDQASVILQEANRNGFGPKDGIKWLFGPTQYVPGLADELDGAYVFSYGYPWTSENPEAKAARKLLKGKVDVLDGFAQQGYQAAGEFQQVLKSVKGPVTRESFLAAARRATNITVPLTPGMKINLVTPSEDPEGGFFVKSVNGRFVPAGEFTLARY
jgi:branched-chain amino acid transport system substrate-binding protein